MGKIFRPRALARQKALFNQFIHIMQMCFHLLQKVEKQPASSFRVAKRPVFGEV
jgi:hypothetical protein